MAAETTKNFWTRVHETQATLKEEFPYVTSMERESWEPSGGVTDGVVTQVIRKIAAIQIVSRTHRLATAEEVTAHLAQQKEAIEPYSLAREVADKNRLRGDIVSNTKRLAKKFKEFQEFAWRSLIWDKQMETFKLSAKIGELSRRWADYAHTPEGALVIADLEAMERELNQMRATLSRLKLIPLSQVHQHIGVPGEI